MWTSLTRPSFTALLNRQFYEEPAVSQSLLLISAFLISDLLININSSVVAVGFKVKFPGPICLHMDCKVPGVVGSPDNSVVGS